MAFDQTLYKENDDPDDTQGLGTYFQFAWAPSDRNEIERYYGAGLVYTGLIPGRDEDVIGLGVASAHLSRRLRPLEGKTQETAIELFYKAPLLPWLTVQPDVQYILNPGGDGKDALAVGVRFEIRQ